MFVYIYEYDECKGAAKRKSEQATKIFVSLEPDKLCPELSPWTLPRRATLAHNDHPYRKKV